MLAGIFENIFDGIQRPLQTIADQSKSVFIPRGIEVPKLDQEKEWQFIASKDLPKGTMITGGDVLGIVDENPLFHEHKIMVEPGVAGRVVELFPDGKYNVTQPVCTIEKANQLLNYLLTQKYSTLLNQLSCVVVDEIHSLGESGPE